MRLAYAYARANGHAVAHANGGTHCHADSAADGNAYPHAYAHANSYSCANVCAYARLYSYSPYACSAYVDARPDMDANPNSYADSCANLDACSYDACSYVDARPDTDAKLNSHADSVANLDACSYVDANTGASSYFSRIRGRAPHANSDSPFVSVSHASPRQDGADHRGLRARWRV